MIPVVLSEVSLPPHPSKLPLPTVGSIYAGAPREEAFSTPETSQIVPLKTEKNSTDVPRISDANEIKPTQPENTPQIPNLDLEEHEEQKESIMISIPTPFPKPESKAC
jgi:hypothetical protein